MFSAAYTGIALPCDGGQSAFLVRALGERRASELMWSARRVDVAEARSLGLVEQVVPVAGLDAAVQATVARLANGPRHALAGVVAEAGAQCSEVEVDQMAERELGTAGKSLLREIDRDGLQGVLNRGVTVL